MLMEGSKQIKAKVIGVIQSLPDDCTLEDIQYHLYVRAKIERGMKAVDDGRILSQEQAEAQVKEWLKSSGQSRP